MPLEIGFPLGKSPYYDGKNRQIARKIGGVIRFSAWDNWELVEEYASSLNVTTGYLQGATGVIKSWGGSGTFYYMWQPIAGGKPATQRSRILEQAS
jgi:hypothetical protein